MYNNFRVSMTWVHTWFGLVLGYVLMVCFFFGALSVFDREIDRWAIPKTRFNPQPMPSFDHLLVPIFAKMQPHSDSVATAAGQVIGELPDPKTMPMTGFYAYTTHRDPVLSIGAEFSVPNKPKDATEDHVHIYGWSTIDPRSGETIPADKLDIGSSWFYPMHYNLHLRWMRLGYWIVGVAALMMLAALVTGVIMHLKIFREFFTFRPWKRTQRSALDLHNMTGVVALPFHFFFALTGLIIFQSIYFPLGETTLKPLHEQHEKLEAQEKGLPHDTAGIPAPTASIDAMMAEAKRRWAARDMAGEVGYVFVEHLGDQNGYVGVFRSGTDRVATLGEAIYFKASTGEVLREDPPLATVFQFNEFLTGLHLQQFEHWLLRWFYVIGGLLGCACVATGFIFFVEKRKQQHAKQDSQGARLVDALAVTTVTGMLIATIAMLVINRILPADMAGKGDWEIYSFWGAWLLALVHAGWRSSPVTKALANPAWREQCLVVALLGIAAVILNWITTGDHLIKTVFTQPYWAVAGVDLSLLATAAIALWSVRKLKQRALAPVKANLRRSTGAATNNNPELAAESTNA